MTIDAAADTWEILNNRLGSDAFPTEFTDPNQAAGITEAGPSAFDVATEFVGPTLRQSPLRAAAAVANYSDWYVDRIWIQPSPVDFGAVISARQITTSVLSTFRHENRTLSSVDLSALSGVTLVAGAVPQTLEPLGEAALTFEAATSGDPEFDADAVFTFDHRTIQVRMSGLRLAVFWYQPEQPLQERLTWFTDIQEVRNGDEFRDSLRATPRQVLNYRVVSETEAEAASLRNLLLVFRSFIFGVPVWHEQRRVMTSTTSGGSVINVDTADVDHKVGGSVLLWEPATRRFQDGQIQSFDANSITLTAGLGSDVTADALVLPVRLGYILDEPRYDDAVVGRFETTVSFETTDNVDLAFADDAAVASVFPTHPDDAVVVLSDPNMLDGRGQSREQTTTFGRVDNEIGIFELSSKRPRSFLRGSKGAIFRDLAELRRWRSLLHWLRGSWGEFYLPTFRNDLPPVLDFTLSAGSVTIANVGISSTLGVVQPRRAVMLELSDGRKFFATVVSAVEIDADTESITLSNPFGIASEVVTASTARISFLELTRVEGDTANILHLFAGDGQIRFATKTIQR